MSKKLTKALRGKRRWIGCECIKFSTRKEIEEFLSNLPAKLYDLQMGKCIISVSLDDYKSVRNELLEGPIKTITSSGKIRLVRERLGLISNSRKR